MSADTAVPASPLMPLRMLGDASVPVCVDDACVVPAHGGSATEQG